MADAENYTKDFPISWEELHRNAKALAWKLLGKGPLDHGAWRGIVAITRGGMVPACIVARDLELLTVETFCISSYNHQNQSNTKILKKPESIDACGDGSGAGWIIVDDLVDTGKTFELARAHYPHAHYACIYTKPAGEKQADTFVTSFSQDTWLHFPWDLENQYATPLARK